jgi:hypothetical protein
MPTIFHCTKLPLSKCNDFMSSVHKNVYFKFQPPALFVFFIFRKISLTKVCSSSEYL